MAADGALLGPEEKTSIDARIAELERALQGADHRAIKQAVDALNHATEDFAARRMDEGIRRVLAGKQIGAL
jgi:molecular chaperone HscA